MVLNDVLWIFFFVELIVCFFANFCVYLSTKKIFDTLLFKHLSIQVPTPVDSTPIAKFQHLSIPVPSPIALTQKKWSKTNQESGKRIIIVKLCSLITTGRISFQSTTHRFRQQWYGLRGWQWILFGARGLGVIAEKGIKDSKELKDGYIPLKMEKMKHRIKSWITYLWMEKMKPHKIKLDPITYCEDGRMKPMNYIQKNQWCISQWSTGSSQCHELYRHWRIRHYCCWT